MYVVCWRIKTDQIVVNLFCSIFQWLKSVTNMQKQYFYNEGKSNISGLKYKGNSNYISLPSILEKEKNDM